MTLRAVISRGIYELGIEADLAQAIGDFAGWGPNPRHRRVRLMQCLSDHDTRQFAADWMLIALRLFAYHGREDLCDALSGAVMDARWEGRRDRERAETDAMEELRERRVPYRVRPAQEEGRRRA